VGVLFPWQRPLPEVLAHDSRTGSIADGLRAEIGAQVMAAALAPPRALGNRIQ